MQDLRNERNLYILGLFTSEIIRAVLRSELLGGGGERPKDGPDFWGEWVDGQNPHFNSQYQHFNLKGSQNYLGSRGLQFFFDEPYTYAYLIILANADQ